MAEEQEKPLTREEVLKMIEEHGGPEGLNLDGRNLRGINLSSPVEEPPLDLHGIRFQHANLQGANLFRANLQGAWLYGVNFHKANLGAANLQRSELSDADLQEVDLWAADLRGTSLVLSNLQGAHLHAAKLQETDLGDAKLSGALLAGADISRHTGLEDADWGPKYILGDEQAGDFKVAADVYRELKQWYTNAGMYDIAGQFYSREMTVRRKALELWPNPLPRAWSKLLAVLCGYGEKPLNVVVSAAVVIFGITLGIYAASTLTFPSSLYYSAASFTALGYGLWVPAPESWVKALGAMEAFIGVFLIALFLITFVRKMTR